MGSVARLPCKILTTEAREQRDENSANQTIGPGTAPQDGPAQSRAAPPWLGEGLRAALAERGRGRISHTCRSRQRL